jgi:ELWxxDGT repeat protein
MKKKLLVGIVSFFGLLSTTAQVTQLNNNQSLEVLAPLNSTKTLFFSIIDDHLWVSEGSIASTLKLSTTIRMGDDGLVLNGKYIFSGSSDATGSELFITDGTPGGTVLLKDIVANAGSSNPLDFAILNGVVYFTAETPTEGRELWRTDGTPGGTSLVKDINPGVEGSNVGDGFNLSAAGNFLLFSAKGNNSGTELWKSDGTSAGTVMVKDINPGMDDSDPDFFWPFGNIVLFTAKTAANGREVWRTDGTANGTFLLKDINPGVGSSTEFEIFPGFSIPITSGFHIFKNKAYFLASDGVNSGNIYVTDGTSVNTTLVKNLVTGAFPPIIFLIGAVNTPDKFFFSLSDGESRSEIWQSDGSPAGTMLFKSFFYDDESGFPILLKDFQSQSFLGEDVLFQGNKFFFIAATEAEGNELWISDGTLPNTKIVKDINPGSASGISDNISYLYTSTTLFFAANNGTNGNELWRTDGTANGTTLVKDIYLNAGDAEPSLMLVNNGKVFFGATDGDNPTATDLFVVDGTYNPLPVKLEDFTVTDLGADALLQWQTLQEVNASHFSVQRSMDAIQFETIGTVLANGNSNRQHQYAFTDKKVVTPPGGIIYYRLQMNDKDGEKEYSKVVSLMRQGGNWQVQLLGNVPGGNITVSVSGAREPMQLIMNDMSGKVLSTRMIPAMQNTIKLPLQGLAKGIYIITLKHGKESQSFKVLN